MITASYAFLPHIRALAVIIFKSFGYISRLYPGRTCPLSYGGF
ncbi:hypothetical protein [Symbiopectobacterium sp. RP]